MDKHRAAIARNWLKHGKTTTIQHMFTYLLRVFTTPHKIVICTMLQKIVIS